MINTPYYILPGRQGFKGAVLDEYLATGHYRMLHMLFTTNHTAVNIESGNIPVFWLRTLVGNIRESKAATGIRKKCAAFTVEYKKAAITPEIEALYSLYHSKANFDTAPTCHGCLHDDRMENPFNSRMIEIRNGTGLIAVGYFDLGKNSITGILNFYHPDYKKYSLGKYLILQKIDYATANEMDYYYTGYLSTAITKFDYKLFPDIKAIEVLLPVEKQWVPYLLLGKEMLEDYYYTYLE